MICYRDRSYCADMDDCKIQECSYRFTKDDQERAKKLGIPVAWAPYKNHCGKFERVTVEQQEICWPQVRWLGRDEEVKK